jgi:hypothetical protein
MGTGRVCLGLPGRQKTSDPVERALVRALEAHRHGVGAAMVEAFIEAVLAALNQRSAITQLSIVWPDESAGVPRGHRAARCISGTLRPRRH